MSEERDLGELRFLFDVSVQRIEIPSEGESRIEIVGPRTEIDRFTQWFDEAIRARAIETDR